VDFSRETGAAVAWLLLFAFLTSSAVYERVGQSAPQVVTAAK
jgi:hypothetical protein